MFRASDFVTQQKRKRQIDEAQRVATNLFHDIGSGDEAILRASHVRIERVVLTNDSTPDCCEHVTGKWLILLRGSAAIDFDGDIGLRQMHVGDYIFLPPLLVNNTSRKNILHFIYTA